MLCTAIGAANNCGFVCEAIDYIGEAGCGTVAIVKGREEIGDESIDLSLSARVVHTMPNELS